MQKKALRGLVTGSSGFLGPWICDAWEREFGNGSVLRSSSSRLTAPSDHTGFHVFDLIKLLESRTLTERSKDWDQSLHGFVPNCIVAAAAMSQPNACEMEPEKSHIINVEAPVFLAGWSADRQVDFIYVSSDMVFDGKSGPFNEESVRNPINTYGQQKLEAEAAILAANPRAMILRLPILFGPKRGKGACFLHQVVNAVASKKPISLFQDEFRSPVSVRAVADFIPLVAARDQTWPRVMHLGGRDRVTRFSMAKLLLHEMKKLGKVQDMAECEHLLRPISIHDVKQAAERPVDLTLISDLAYQYGFDPWSLDKEIEWVINA